jgi:hypothetical protein
MATIEQLLTEAAREETEARTIAAVVAMLEEKAARWPANSPTRNALRVVARNTKHGDWRAYLPKGGEGE